MLLREQPCIPHASRDRALEEVRGWLERFAAAVRGADYETGRGLFDPGVVSFGTRGTLMSGLDQLVSDQWSCVWGATRGFDFSFDQLQCEVAADVAWAAAPWHSQGQRPDGSWFDRFGRATYVLRRRGDRWVAVHSHHSLNPV